jgi:fused signal recognition particle receptor
MARSTAEAEWIERRAREVRARLAEEEEKTSWLGRLKRGLGRSSTKLTTGIGDLFTKRRLDAEALEELEELLITGDLGIETSARLTRALADTRFGQEVTAEEVRAALAEEVAKVLEPVARTIAINDAYRPHDCILVLDATVGQNAHNQVEVFRQMVDVTGLAVTKLDGSAKGGVVVALAERFDLPVYAIGVGEGLDDMRAFEARAYARSLLGLDA